MAGDLQQAYDAALVNDSLYQAARAELASSQQNLPMARAGLRPTIALSLSNAQIDGTRTANSFSAQPVSSPLDYRAPAQNLSLRTPLFNREASQKVMQAQAQVQYAEAVFALRAVDLVDRLANAYLERLLSLQAVQAAAADLGAAQAQMYLVSRRLQLGEATRPDLADADAALDVAKVRQAEAQNRASVAILGLRQITGLESVGSMGAAGGDSPLWPHNIPAIPLGFVQLREQAYTHSPGLAVRRSAVSVAQATVARNSAGHYPRLDMVASTSYTRNDSVNTLNQSVRQRSIGLQLNLPLYSGGYVDAAVTQALADQGKAEAELLSEQQTMFRDLTKLYLSDSTGRAKMQAYQKTADVATLALEGVRKSLSAGFSTQADIVQAQNKLAQAKNELAQVTCAYLLSRVRLLARAGYAPYELVSDLDSLLTANLASP